MRFFWLALPAGMAIALLLSSAAGAQQHDALQSIGRREVTPARLASAALNTSGTVAARTELVISEQLAHRRFRLCQQLGRSAMTARASVSIGCARLSARLPVNPADVPAGPCRISLPCTVLIAGDSMMQNGCLGGNLEQQLNRIDGISVVRWAKESTGLARLDFFDVPGQLAQLLKRHRPALVIVQWGANDCQSVTSRSGKALACFGTAAWDAEYGARVRQLSQQAQDFGAQLVFVGLPNMAKKGYVDRIAHLNAVVSQAATEAGALFISTWEITSESGSGAPLPKISFNGRSGSMRQKDGIHLSNLGAAFAAEYICRQLTPRLPH